MKDPPPQDPIELADTARALAKSLAKEAARYHVKSDQHEILGYESATVAAYAKELLGGEPVSAHLRESTLLGQWGRGYRWDNEELVTQTALFYQKLRNLIPE